jgi:hypothetical protein
VTKNRAHGYSSTPDGFRLAPYINHRWPYAAGSLCSTAGDLTAWNRALHAGRILSSASYRELVTPGRLNDGTALHYGMALFVDSTFGRPAYSHSGGIFGFVSELDYFPADSLSVVVLMNSDGGASAPEIARAIERVIFGEDRVRQASSYKPAVSDFAGQYHSDLVDVPPDVTITADSGRTQLRADVGLGPWTLEPTATDRFEWVIPDQFRIAQNTQRMRFARTNGRVTGIWVDVGSFAVFYRKM